MCSCNLWLSTLDQVSLVQAVTERKCPESVVRFSIFIAALILIFMTLGEGLIDESLSLNDVVFM